MEINGLPLHPLAVHGAVVLAPLAALLALAYLVPRWRDRLRWPMVVGALLAVASVLLAYFSGDSFREANDFFNAADSPVTAKIDDHEQLGGLLLWVTLGFGVSALLNGVLHPRVAWARWLLGLLLLVDAVAVLVLVVMTGDSGARAVWGEGFSG
ncbi:DUF2231 domain-containing protein [Nocardioides sambongensis]|uniref:DUF2231 domain-containing protein n=1 Tax=Nocardioides sambongensis TaxID=2589074 RepID=UPI0011299460|nr:DUF2231 domain-containing protein [Nocardioides sambongensis]